MKSEHRYGVIEKSFETDTFTNWTWPVALEVRLLIQQSVQAKTEFFCQ